MNVLDVIIIIAVVCAAIFTLCYVAHHKDGGCEGCNGDCSSCKKGDK